MLNWLTSRFNSPGNNTNHPLGSDKAIAAYLADLPTLDPQRTLRELNDWFEDPASFIDQLPPAAALRALEKLDDFAQEPVTLCWEQILNEAKSNRHGQVSGVALQNYLTGSHACNRRLLEVLAASPEHNQDKQLLARLATRAMHNWVEAKKLGRMKYQAAEPSWWEAAHALLRQGWELGIAHLKQRVYAHYQAPSSLWSEYQVGLLFETAPLTNLTVNELDATDRLARWIEPNCKLVDTHQADTPFCVLPEGGNAPIRWLPEVQYPPATRYFGVGQGQEQLVQLRAGIVQEGKLPEWLAASGCNREQTLQMLPHLIANWSATPPNRQHPRLQAKGTIRVVHGLDMARRMLAASEFAKSGRDLDYDSYLRDFQARHREHAVVTETPPPPPKTPMDVLHLLETAGDKQMMEQWEVSDMSKGGLGVRFPSRRPWMRIGALVAYRDERDLSWRIAIIRRLGSSRGKPNAGLSTFLGTPACSQIRVAASQMTDAWSQSTKETSGLGWHSAILISEEAKLILIPSGIFSPDRPVHISIQGHFRPANLVKLQGRGNDYDLAVYQDREDPPAANGRPSPETLEIL